MIDVEPIKMTVATATAQIPISKKVRCNFGFAGPFRSLFDRCYAHNFLKVKLST